MASARTCRPFSMLVPKFAVRATWWCIRTPLVVGPTTTSTPSNTNTDIYIYIYRYIYIYIHILGHLSYRAHHKSQFFARHHSYLTFCSLLAQDTCWVRVKVNLEVCVPFARTLVFFSPGCFFLHLADLFMHREPVHLALECASVLDITNAL